MRPRGGWQRLWRAGERPRPGFWLFSVLGAALVVGYALAQGIGSITWGDPLMLAAILVIDAAENADAGPQYDGIDEGELNWAMATWAEAKKKLYALALSRPAEDALHALALDALQELLNELLDVVSEDRIVEPICVRHHFEWSQFVEFPFSRRLPTL